MYCKEVDLGGGPNGGLKNVAHNITGLIATKVHTLLGCYAGGGYFYSLPMAHGSPTAGIMYDAEPSYIQMWSANDHSSAACKARIVYAK